MTAGRKHSETRQRTKMVAVRLLPAEYVALDAAAIERGVSLSELVRSAALTRYVQRVTS